MSTVQEKLKEENIDTELEQLRQDLNLSNRINRLADIGLTFLEREKRKEEKVSQKKISEFEFLLQPVYAAVKRKGEMMNRIYDENHIDSSEKGFLEREMAIAVIHVIPKYKNKSIDQMQNNVRSWIDSANKIRIETNLGGLIHPTEAEGHNKSRYHILKHEDDFKKQKENLSFRTESASKTEENRTEEFSAIEQMKKEDEVVQEPQGMIMNNEGKVLEGGE